VPKSYQNQYQKKIITDVIDFRLVKTLLNSMGKGASKAVVGKALDRMIGDPKVSIKDAYPLSVRATLQLADFEKMVGEIAEQISNFQTDNPSEKETFHRSLEELLNVIRRKLTDLGK
jgi:hypothetical protein